jgi:hypothetical protein
MPHAPNSRAPANNSPVRIFNFHPSARNSRAFADNSSALAQWKMPTESHSNSPSRTETYRHPNLSRLFPSIPARSPCISTHRELNSAPLARNSNARARNSEALELNSHARADNSRPCARHSRTRADSSSPHAHNSLALKSSFARRASSSDVHAPHRARKPLTSHD